jgi:hypothetical protein
MWKLASLESCPILWELSTSVGAVQLCVMLSSYLGGRTRDLYLDNVTMKLVALLCHLSSIYTLLDR